MALQQVPIAKVRIDGGTQQRVGINQEKVDEYSERLAEMPAVKIKFDGSDFWLWDGFHRYHATRKSGAKTISAIVEKGTRRDAQLASFKANSTNGLHRSNADKRKAVNAMLDDPEWGEWPGSRIAQACDVSEGLVRLIRDEREKGSFATQNHDTYRSDNSYIRMDEDECDDAGRDNEGCSDTAEDAPAQSDTPAAVPVNNSSPEAATQADSSPASAIPADEEGNPIPDDPKLRQAFGAGGIFDETLNLLRQARGRVNSVIGDGKDAAGIPGGECLASERQEIARALDNARNLLTAMRPHAVCPYPHGRTRCEACKGLGWVTKSTWKAAPADYKARMKGKTEGRAA